MLAGTVTASAAITSGDVIAIDFSKKASTTPGNWNNIVTAQAGDAGNFQSTSLTLDSDLIRLSDGAATGIGLDVASSGTGLNTIGIGGLTVVSEGATASFSGIGAVPDTAQVDVFYVTANNATFTFTGLDDSLTYDLEFQSWTDTTARDQATATITGGSFLNVDPNDSPSVYAFNNISTDGSGNIELVLATGSDAAHINALQLVAIPEPSTVGFLFGSVALILSAIRRRS